MPALRVREFDVTHETPVLVLRVGQRMVDIKDEMDGLMEAVYWDADNEKWEKDTGSFGDEIAKGLNLLGYRPEDTRG